MLIFTIREKNSSLELSQHERKESCVERKVLLKSGLQVESSMRLSLLGLEVKLKCTCKFYNGFCSAYLFTVPNM